MTRKQEAAGNQGIVGNVRADVLAVGANAHAEKIVYTHVDSQAMQAAVADLHRIIATLPLVPVARDTVATDMHALQAEVRAEQPSRDKIGQILSGLAGKLKMVGLVLTEGVALGEAIKKIASLARVPLALLGLGS